MANKTKVAITIGLELAESDVAELKERMEEDVFNWMEAAGYKEVWLNDNEFDPDMVRVAIRIE